MGNEICPFAKRCTEPCKPKMKEAVRLGKDTTRGANGYLLARAQGAFDRSLRGAECPTPIAASLRTVARGR